MLFETFSAIAEIPDLKFVNWTAQLDEALLNGSVNINLTGL